MIRFFLRLLYHTKNYQGTTTLTQALQERNLLYHTKNYQGTTTSVVAISSRTALYHTKNHQGTTTTRWCCVMVSGLYHTKNHQGTTTAGRRGLLHTALYHTKNHQGTTTGERGRARRGGIIPYKDLTVRTPALLLGNFCVAFFVRSGYNNIRRLSIALSAFSGRGHVGM